MKKKYRDAIIPMLALLFVLVMLFFATWAMIYLYTNGGK